ncbi:MAG: hypothetical protein H0W72_14415 [Planctomycetes bacterium]|nr:hypothetical protein [Planctomycetota bacterium]
MRARRGSLLIIVAGICALLASLALTFLMRMRSDSEDMSLVLRETQARMMLGAACAYILESGRLGIDDPITAAHEEGFGWVDVRDGSVGPKATIGGAMKGLPIGAVARFPLHVMRRPPFAIRGASGYNPISAPPIDLADIWTPERYGMAFLRNPDPQPAVDNGWTGYPGATVNANGWAAFAQGERTPIAGTRQLAWFRVLRQSADEFVVTCGGGGTLGFQTWADVTPAARDEFAGDSGLFDLLLAQEVRLWYLVKWSAAVASQTSGLIRSDLADPQMPEVDGSGLNDPTSIHMADHYLQRPLNAEHANWKPQGFGPNPVGTIRSIMRLREAPARW